MADTNDSGNTLSTAKDLGDLTYNVTALGALGVKEFSETVGGDTDTADYFKFNVTQGNGLYLNLTSTVGTKFQIQNSLGTAVGTMSLGSMGMPATMGSSNYMINLDAGTYYLKVNTTDSAERAAYTVKTVFAPQDTQNDNLGVYTPGAVKLGSLGMNASLKTQANLWGNVGSGTSSLYMSGQNSNDQYSFTLSQDAKVKFDLSALKNAGSVSASISSSNGTSVGNIYLYGSMAAPAGTGSSSGDQAVLEKDLLAGTYNISIYGSGLSKYDYATGTSAYLPTSYQLSMTSSASAMVTNDSGNTLSTAKDLGDLTYNVTALGALGVKEFSETVGGDTDTADYFKFNVTQGNGLYLNLTSTVGTKFQIQNSLGTAVGTMSLGSMGMPATMGSSNYMINLDAGTYYLKVNTTDSAERAAYTVKTVFAPQDTQNDNLGVYTPGAVKLGSLGMNASLKTQANLWGNVGSGTSSLYMSGQNSNDQYSFTLSQDAKVKFDLSALKNAGSVSASISSSNGTSVGNIYLYGSMAAPAGTGSSSGDQAVLEKDLLAGTYNISIYGSGLSKYDYATGTSAYLPTSYQLSMTSSASAMVTNDSGNTLSTAKDLGDLTYNVTALGALGVKEFSETVGGDTDTADYFKFNVTQGNGLYLNLTSTVGTKFQIQNSLGTAVGTMSLGSMGMPATMGSSNYMINLDAGTYYLKVNTTDSAERAAYTVKTVFAPQDTQNDNLGVYTPGAVKLGSLGMNASLKTQANLWGNVGSGTSSLYMSGQNSNDQYSFTLSQDAKVKFDLSALKNAGSVSASISSSNGTSVGNIYLYGSMAAPAGTGSSSGDQAVLEKDLLAGTYNISIYGSGLSKYDYATGTSAYLPTSYQLNLTTGTGSSVDTTPPTLVISSDKTSVMAGDTAVLSFAFSEKPVGFDASDITVTNGTISNLAVSSTDPMLYTASFTPSSTVANGTAATVSVGAGSYKDAAGNNGAAATLSTLKVVVPTYTLTSSVSSVDEGSTVTFTVNTQNLATGSALAYSLSGTGISSGDVDGGLLSGTLKTDATGKASLAVTLLADKMTEGDETLNFGVAGQTASVKVKDTSTATVSAQPGVVFTDATNLSTSEAGGRAQFKVALASAPRYDVTVTMTSNDQTEGLFVASASTSGTTAVSATKVLTFTANNWNQAQTVSLIGVDDSETDGDVAYVISTKVSSSDLNYDGMRAGQGLSISNLFVVNLDDDKPDETYGTNNNDVLTGGPGPSDMYGGYGRDEMYGGKGNDRVYGGYGDDVLYGEDGNDSLEGEQGSDKLDGGGGDDSLSGGSGNDTLLGGAGNDVLDGNEGPDSMDGGTGADTYYVDNSGDVVTDSGGDGALDTVYIASYLGSTYVLGKGIVNGTLGAQAGQGSLSGNASDNKLTGNTQGNTLSGGAGSDTIDGGGGSDTIDGGDGTDTLVLAGNAADYTVTLDANKLLTLITNTVSKEVQTLNAVEFVQFKDTLKSVLSTVKGDTTAPTLSAKSPAGNATGVTLGTNLTLTFSEAVQAGTGHIVLKKAGVVERTISVGDANQVIFAGSTVVVNPDADLSASASYTLEMGSGVVVDLSGNAYAGLSGYGFATAATATQGAQFVSLANAKLVKDAANNKSTVSFSINMNAGVLDGQKINGVLFDLDYDHTKVSAARLSGVQYDSSGESTPVWQFLTPNLSGSTANGKIVGLTTTDASNPVVVSGKTMDVTLTLNQAVDSFKVGFNKQSAHVFTVDGVDHAVATGADVLALPSSGYALKATAVHWKGLSGGTSKVLGDVSLVKGSQTMKTSSTGEAVFETSTDAKASVVVAKAVAESEKVAAGNAVNLTDAIGILKMIVGLNVNATGTALSPYQVVAADFNQDGTVGLTDAIDVLKAVVGLSAPSPGWVVLDQTKVSSTLTMDSYNSDTAKKQSSGWMSPTLSVNMDTSQEVKLVGVLAGDVDGSWAGA